MRCFFVSLRRIICEYLPMKIVSKTTIDRNSLDEEKQKEKEKRSL
jgi:hypothetical protein